MASYKFMAFLAVFLVLLPTTILGDHLTPFFEKICEEVECGKGTCKANISYPLNYICECEAGWKQTQDDDDVDDDHRFLPCIIPNCTLDFSCQPAPPPVPEKEVPHNMSFFDPCFWTYCGEGNCTKTTTYKHTCECRSGFSNLLNKTFFPCYSQCTLGSDCSRLGITVKNVENSPSDDGNEATSFLPGKLPLLAVLMMSAVMTFLK
ncbi:uncharacterized protein LOC110809683 [Carica papaya]|uniref:uncharacterized protein LOC110809683 n=1 Tax=Carica papaya TaxID=3649 RepID=UPI000B8CC2DC|nr:uncharacterized protein LOC110809683 [Carica papaya]